MNQNDKLFKLLDELAQGVARDTAPMPPAPETVELFVVQWLDDYDGKWRTDNTQPSLHDLPSAQRAAKERRDLDGVRDTRIVRIAGTVVGDE